MYIEKSLNIYKNKTFGLLVRFVAVEIERSGIIKVSNETLDYLSEFTGCSKVNVAKALNILIDQEYISGHKLLVNEISKKQHKKPGVIDKNIKQEERVSKKKIAFMERIYSKFETNNENYLKKYSEQNIEDAKSIIYNVVSDTTKIEKLMSLSNSKISDIVDKSLLVSSNLDVYYAPVSYMFKVMLKTARKPIKKEKKRRGKKKWQK